MISKDFITVVLWAVWAGPEELSKSCGKPRGFSKRMTIRARTALSTAYRKTTLLVEARIPFREVEGSRRAVSQGLV